MKANSQVSLPVVATVILGAVAVFVGGFAFFGNTRKAAQLAAPPSSSMSSAISPGSGRAAFDVPKLLGLSINQVRAKLGTPSEYTPPESVKHPANLTQWDMTFKKGEQDLLVTYDPRTGRVIDFFLPTTDSTGATSNLNALRIAGGLTSAPSRYSLQGVPAMGHSGQFTGLKVVPAP